MNTTQWFHDQLQASADGFVWGVKQVPALRQQAQPPKRLGEWTVARHVFHMLYYEQTIALPSMQQWLGEPCPATDDLDEGLVWKNRQTENVEDLLAGFEMVRADQIALVDKFNEAIDLWPVRLSGERLHCSGL